MRGCLIAIYSDPDHQVVTYPGGKRVIFRNVSVRVRSDWDPHGSEEATAWEWFAPSKLLDELLEYAVVWLGDAFANDAAVRVR